MCKPGWTYSICLERGSWVLRPPTSAEPGTHGPGRSVLHSRSSTGPCAAVDEEHPHWTARNGHVRDRKPCRRVGGSSYWVVRFIFGTRTISFFVQTMRDQKKENKNLWSAITLPVRKQARMLHEPFRLCFLSSFLVCFLILARIKAK